MENAIALSAWELAINPSLYALMRLGFTDEAADYMTWREARCREAAHDRGLQVLYTIDRNPQVPETTPDHLDRYQGSPPVRVGNSAAGQLQLDVDGGLMDSVYLFNKHARPIGYELWEALGRLPAIPDFIVLIFLDIATIVVVVLAWFAILFTRRYPRGIFEFVQGVIRWHNRVTAYAFVLVTDRYPPFSLTS